jgi:hypothetical protein
MADVSMGSSLFNQKKIMKNVKVISLVAFLLVGCATSANYETLLQSWVGSNADNLVMRWGPPGSSYPLSNGGKVLEYSNQRSIQLGGYATTVPQTTYTSGTAKVYGTGGSSTGTYSETSTTYVQQTTPVQNIAMQCITRFTVNSQGTVTSWAWQGNDCKAMYPKAGEPSSKTMPAEPSRQSRSTTAPTPQCDAWGNPKDIHGNPCRK